MGRFYNGMHFSYQTKLGPNERFGIESEDDFQELVLFLEKKKKEEKLASISQIKK